jgi:hypothetical protein
MFLQDLIRCSFVFEKPEDTKEFLDFLLQYIADHPDCGLALFKVKNAWAEA